MKYDQIPIAIAPLIVILGAMTATIGSHLPIVGLNGLRLLAFVTFLVVLLRAFDAPLARATTVVRVHFFLALFWLTEAVLAALGLGADEASIKEVSEIVFGFILLLTPITLGLTSENALLRISRFWIFSYFIATTFSTIELITGEKLESNYTRSQPDYVFDQLFLVSTFDNPNNYAVFLLFCLPFLAYQISFSRVRTSALLWGSAILVAFAQIVMTASRAAIAGSIVFFLVWLIFRKGIVATGYIIVSIAAISGVLFAAVDDSKLDSLVIVSKLANSAEDLDYGSSRERYNIYIDSLQMVADNPLFGVGPGQFSRYISTQPMPYAVEVPNPHSMLFEIASQYGLPVFMLFLACLFSIGISAWKKYSFSRNDGEKRLAAIVLSALPSYLISVNINSTYMSLQFGWIFVGSIAVMAMALNKQ